MPQSVNLLQFPTYTLTFLIQWFLFWRWKNHVSQKHSYTFIRLHVSINRHNITWMYTALKTKKILRRSHKFSRNMLRKYGLIKQDRQCACNITLRCFRATIVAMEKQYVLYILNVCLEPYVTSMECACFLLSSIACSALKYFSTLSHKRHHFRKKVIENEMCVLIVSTTFVWNISHAKKNWER